MLIRKLSGLLLVACLSASAVWAQDTTPEATAPVKAASVDETAWVEHTSEDRRLTLLHPEGWLVDRRSATDSYFANTEAALDHSFGDPFDEGEIQMSTFAGNIEDILGSSELEADASTLAILEMAISAASGDAQFAEPVATSVNDRTAASVRLSGDGYEGYAVVISFENDLFVAVQVVTAPGELESWQETITTFVESVQFADLEAAEAATEVVEEVEVTEAPELPELTETYVAEDGLLSVDHPAGWATRSSFPPGVDIGSSEEALDLWLGDDFAPGDAHFGIVTGTAEEIFDTLPDGERTALSLLEYTLEMNADDDMTTSAIEEITINGRNAAALRVELPESALYITIIEYEDGQFVGAQAQSAPDELEQNVDLLLAILETLEIPAP